MSDINNISSSNLPAYLNTDYIAKK